MLKSRLTSVALGMAMGAATLSLTGPLRIPLATIRTAMAAEPSALFSQGLRDRTKWENWFSALTGDKRAGAEFWAAQRPLNNPGECVGTPDFVRGCNEAKGRLTGPDLLRKSEPDYKAGWNSYVAATTPAPVQLAPPPAKQQAQVDTEQQQTGSNSAGPPPDFETARTGLHAGPVKRPNFSTNRESYMFRTRIREGAAKGVNFAERVAVVEIGCGTSCINAYAVDLATGRIFNFPLGGEEYYGMTLQYRSWSRLLVAWWMQGGPEGSCVRQDFVWYPSEGFHAEGSPKNVPKPCPAVGGQEPAGDVSAPAARSPSPVAVNQPPAGPTQPPSPNPNWTVSTKTYRNEPECRLWNAGSINDTPLFVNFFAIANRIQVSLGGVEAHRPPPKKGAATITFKLDQSPKVWTYQTEWTINAPDAFLMPLGAETDAFFQQAQQAKTLYVGLAGREFPVSLSGFEIAFAKLEDCKMRRGHAATTATAPIASAMADPASEQHWQLQTMCPLRTKEDGIVYRPGVGDSAVSS